MQKTLKGRKSAPIHACSPHACLCSSLSSLLSCLFSFTLCVCASSTCLNAFLSLSRSLNPDYTSPVSLNLCKIKPHRLFIRHPMYYRQYIIWEKCSPSFCRTVPPSTRVDGHSQRRRVNQERRRICVEERANGSPRRAACVAPCDGMSSGAIQM